MRPNTRPPGSAHVAYHPMPGMGSIAPVSAIAVTAALLRKRPLAADELGAVSDRWVAQHRSAPP